MTKKPEPKPVLLMSRHIDGGEDEIMETCPYCGYRDTLDGFDVGGADPGNLFCNQCNHEFICG